MANVDNVVEGTVPTPTYTHPNPAVEMTAWIAHGTLWVKKTNNQLGCTFKEIYDVFTNFNRVVVCTETSQGAVTAVNLSEHTVTAGSTTYTAASMDAYPSVVEMEPVGRD